MSWKRKVLIILHTLMRACLLIILELFLKFGFSLLLPKGLGLVLSNNLSLEQRYATEDTELYSIHRLINKSIVDIGVTLFWFLIYLQVSLTVLAFFNTKLFAIYIRISAILIRISSILIIIFSYQMNTEFVNIYSKALVICSKLLFIVEIAIYHLTQILLGIAFSAANTTDYLAPDIVLIITFIPTWACQLPIPLTVTKLTPLFSTIACVFLLAYSIWKNDTRVCETVYKRIAWCYTMVQNHCLHTVIENQKIKLHIPHIFQGFWIIRLFVHLLKLQCSCNFPLPSMFEILQEYIIHGSENIIALLGMTCVISLLCQFIGYNIQAFLQIKKPAERDIGSISAFLFLILSLQNGITGLDSERFYSFIHNLSMLCTVLLHFTQNMLHTHLLSLSVARNSSITKHARSLIISIFLITVPIIVLVYQWKSQDASIRLLAITSFMIELFVKTLVSLTIYILNTIDSHKNGLWENLDNYIYYLEATASFTEFIVGVYLMFNGLRILIFESNNAMRACMLCLHAYFNIWVKVKKSWESYLLRQSITQDLSFLRDATKRQLKNEKGVCPICFQELNAAKITICNHFYHSICLYKWLREQNTCPLCQTILYRHKHNTKPYNCIHRF